MCTKDRCLPDRFYNLQLPSELRPVAARHQKHVTELVSQLRMVGIDEESIERNVDQLISSYKAELIEAIKALQVCVYV